MEYLCYYLVKTHNKQIPRVEWNVREPSLRLGDLAEIVLAGKSRCQFECPSSVWCGAGILSY